MKNLYFLIGKRIFMKRKRNTKQCYKTKKEAESKYKDTWRVR